MENFFDRGDDAEGVDLDVRGVHRYGEGTPRATTNDVVSPADASGSPDDDGARPATNPDREAPATLCLFPVTAQTDDEAPPACA